MAMHKVARICQTSEINCGPTALAQLFGYYGDDTSAAEIERATKMTNLGTLDSYLGQTAIKFGYKVKITPHNLYAIDPTWTKLPRAELLMRLKEEALRVADPDIKFSCEGYAGFVDAGGILEFKTISPKLLIEKLKKHPFLIGFCLTYLYGESRPPEEKWGYRYGHFAVLDGYDPDSDTFSVVDPYHAIPFCKTGRYKIKSDRLVAAIFLGEATRDCTILEIWK